MKFSIQELRSLQILEGLSETQLAWFRDRGVKVRLARGDRMFERGQPAEFMFIVVRGTIEGYESVGGQVLLVATTRSGQVTGMLPYSRMTHYPRYTVAADDSEVLRVGKIDFQDMLTVSPEMGQRLVAEMSERVRGDVRLEQQQEKMTALGRLSAGLAHELNNPAAAIRRASSAVTEQLAGLTDLISNLVSRGATPAHLEAIRRLRQRVTERRTAGEAPLERSQREDDLAVWLENCGASKAWDVAGVLADASLRVEDLDEFAKGVPEALRAEALAWVACDLAVQRLATEIASSAARISALVASVKLYSHMDRSPDHKPTDVREGIDHTLVLLRHQFNQKAIRLVRDYQQDLPRVSANAGQLNQVWTNLVENAIDAVQDGGEVRIEVDTDGADHVSVRVIDDGHGIPEELRSRIFEPFFTTKDVGEGLGLGLDIADRIVRTHKGSIAVETAQGRTVMHVRLPVLEPAAPN